MQTWIKLYTRILDDYTMGTLTSRLYWRSIQLMLLEAKIASGAEPYPSAQEMAEIMNISVNKLRRDLSELCSEGILTDVIEKYVRFSDPSTWTLKWRFSDHVRKLYAIGYGRATGKEWKASRDAVLHRDRYKCQYCGRHAEHVDHIIPVCQGGGNDLDNLVAACAKCNLSKGGRTPAQAGMLLKE